jgi:hypothetical protein
MTRISEVGQRYGLLILAILTWSVHQSAAAQTLSKPLPQFEDYPVKEVFNQPPHTPILTTPEQHHYRTRIREGVEKGWGVWINGEWGKEQNRPGPNFAGYYIVIVWGCGAPCLMMAVCDARTGAVYNPPLSWTGELRYRCWCFRTPQEGMRISNSGGIADS